MDSLAVGEEQGMDGADANQALFSAVEIATETPLARPEGLALHEDLGFLYVVDTGNGLVRRMHLATGWMEVIAGSASGGVPADLDPRPATEVDLMRPVGLALDPAGQRLYVADLGCRPLECAGAEQPGQVLEITLDEPVPMLRSLLAPQAAGFHPGRLAFHRFGAAMPVLFVADLGQENTFFGASPFRPTLQLIDLDDPVPFLAPVSLSFGPGGAYSSLRRIFDLRIDVPGDGSANVLLAVDAGEAFETYTNPALVPVNPTGSVAMPIFFEIDCHDGFSDDDAPGGDALVDFEDPDCSETLQAQVLRLPYDALGSGLLTPQVEVLLTGFRKFTVDATYDPACMSTPEVFDTPPLDFPTVTFAALAPGPEGALFAFDSFAQQASLFVPGPMPRSIPVFGTPFELASPFDGASPRVTRLNLPRALAVDSLFNLFVADTVHNRIRQAWIGDLIGR